MRPPRPPPPACHGAGPSKQLVSQVWAHNATRNEPLSPGGSASTRSKGCELGPETKGSDSMLPSRRTPPTGHLVADFAFVLSRGLQVVPWQTWEFRSSPVALGQGCVACSTARAPPNPPWELMSRPCNRNMHKHGATRRVSAHHEDERVKNASRDKISRESNTAKVKHIMTPCDQHACMDPGPSIV